MKNENKICLHDLADKILRISRASLDIATGRKLRELAAEVRAKANEIGGSGSAQDLQDPRTRRDH